MVFSHSQMSQLHTQQTKRLKENICLGTRGAQYPCVSLGDKGGLFLLCLFLGLPKKTYTFLDFVRRNCLGIIEDIS